MAVKKTLKLTSKLVHSIVTEVCGEDCIDLYKALKSKKNISEFVLAEAIDREINVTRNMLYRMYHSNLVSFIRKKDKQKGWYIYYWTFNPLQLSHLFKNLRTNRMEKLQERIDREQGSHFVVCPERCMRLDFERATEFDYKCPECGILLHMTDNTEIVKNLVNELKVLEKTPGRFK